MTQSLLDWASKVGRQFSYQPGRWEQGRGSGGERQLTEVVDFQVNARLHAKLLQMKNELEFRRAEEQ